MQIGFDVSGEGNSDNEDFAGYAENSETVRWTDDLPEYFFNAWTRFCLVYGIYASFRDLIGSFL